ncbi:indole-3-glycerol phosphate synthase TrpC [Anaerosinus massiliensis]|uniref:indole-3-glycerol phosphate synthase TrpC n=1 Tax=Massilibacillus massiliensis TaxID=1806837 RepID=UPI000B285D2B|nr:indole-3-glycerol phosphate synthase TrpC [Massilibacillus massiliensis]
MLDAILAKKKIEVAEDKARIHLRDIKRELVPGEFAMSRRIRKQPWSLIAECKLQSPSKGRLCTKYTIEELAKIYEKSGATALSVHTDAHFLGQIGDIAKIKALVTIPVLRKDFIMDEYQIYQARKAGADAILLIARILSPAQLKEYLYTAWGLGMDCLVEVHSEADIKATLDTPAELIGINNRNLQNFTTNISHTLSLLQFCDKNRTIISESGIHGHADTEKLKQAGVKGVLVGEGLVKADDVAKMTQELACV